MTPESIHHMSRRPEPCPAPLSDGEGEGSRWALSDRPLLSGRARQVCRGMADRDGPEHAGCAASGHGGLALDRPVPSGRGRPQPPDLEQLLNEAPGGLLGAGSEAPHDAERPHGRGEERRGPLLPVRVRKSSPTHFTPLPAGEDLDIPLCTVVPVPSPLVYRKVGRLTHKEIDEIMKVYSTEPVNKENAGVQDRGASSYRMLRSRVKNCEGETCSAVGRGAARGGGARGGVGGDA